MTEAPIRDPTAGKAATASLAGEGAGAADGPSAITALMEAAAKMTAQAILFISICTEAGRIDSRAPRVRGGVVEEYEIRSNSILRNLLPEGVRWGREEIYRESLRI